MSHLPLHVGLSVILTEPQEAIRVFQPVLEFPGVPQAFFLEVLLSISKVSSSLHVELLVAMKAIEVTSNKDRWLECDSLLVVFVFKCTDLVP